MVSEHRGAEMKFESSIGKRETNWTVVAIPMLVDLSSLLAVMSCPPHCGTTHSGFSLLGLPPRCAPCSLPEG